MGDSSSGAGKRRVCVDELRCAESFWWFAVSRFATRCTSRSSCWRRFIYCEAFDHRRQVSCRDGVLHRPVADEARPDCQVRALWTHALTFLDEFREMFGFRILFFLFCFFCIVGSWSHSDTIAGRSRSFRLRLPGSLRRLSLPWRAPPCQTTSPQDPRTPSRDSDVDSKHSKPITTSTDTSRFPCSWKMLSALQCSGSLEVVWFGCFFSATKF